MKGNLVVASSAFQASSAISAANAASVQAGPESLLKKGEYLARAADCMSCHTGSKDKPYAGGLGLKSVYGSPPLQMPRLSKP
jgi:hypothetical protein